MIMKKRNVQRIFLSLFHLFIFFLALSVMISCSKNSTTSINPEENSLVNINIVLKQSSFDNAANLGSKASSASNRLIAATTQTNTIELNKDLLLIAEISPNNEDKIQSKGLIAGSKKAAVENNDVAVGIRYKIAVYDNSGKYIQEKNYVHGQENLTEAFQLPGGKNYTFIAYSVNSATALPSIDFLSVDDKNLSNSSIAVTGEQDLLFFRKDMAIANNTNNNLEIILKHLFSQITTTIDATESGYEITDINSSFTISHKPYAQLNFSDARIARTGTATGAAVAFSSMGTMLLTSLPNMINADPSTNSSFTITTMTIGPLTQTNITPFSNLSITPGVKYQMKLKIVPTDEYLIHKSIPAVRINGNIWMQHNLGVNITLDPAETPQTSALFGNYYQWGRNTIVASPTESYTNSNWSKITDLPIDSWNSGTENQPIKTVTDPCPSGYRVPTKSEMDRLISSTVPSEKGTWTLDDNNYASAKILTSKRRKSVAIYFPIQGTFGYGVGGNDGISPTNLVFRGIMGFYWLSSASTSNRMAYSYFNSTSVSTIWGGTNYDQQSYSQNIRCIAE